MLYVQWTHTDCQRHSSGQTQRCFEQCLLPVIVAAYEVATQLGLEVERELAATVAARHPCGNAEKGTVPFPCGKVIAAAIRHGTPG